MRASLSNSEKCRRPAFTLLEVLLASAIAVLLFGGLYVAMQVELRQAAEGREAIERATLARAIINRLSIDLGPSATPPRSKITLKSAGSSTGTSSSTTAAATSTSASATSSMTTSTDTSGTTTEQVATAITAQAGVIGYEDRVVIFAARASDLHDFAMMDPESQVPGDIRRISYWVGDNGGLYRQEVPFYSNETFYAANDVVPDERFDNLIAPEVVAIGFEYYDINAPTDNSGWTSSWDGSQLGPDGMTPLGPPAAIRVSFTIRTVDPYGVESTKDYRHVIPLLTASGPDAVDPMSPETDTDAGGAATTGTTTP